ncbi:MAG: hypothetical protein OXK77_05740, partial [Gemmatimonadota bacterium]|nr:hypothetical protein [Gemmatimonadota bacterium]MDE2866040.1 hypothetical protein [Gemmatimonadota bacterium]
MNIDELGKFSPSIPDLTKAQVNELAKASRSISDLVMSREKEIRKLSASAANLRRIVRSSFDSQFREAAKASEVFREIAGRLPVQGFEQLFPNALTSGSFWETVDRGLSSISRIQDEVAKTIRESEAERLQDLSRIRDEIGREATRASDALREVVKGISDTSTIRDAMSEMVGASESSAFIYEPESLNSTLELQEAPKDELMEQISDDLAAIRRHMDRWCLFRRSRPPIPSEAVRL